MRILVNERNSRRIETDSRISKYSYRLRKGYSIKDVILEKRISYENSIITGYHTIHNMIDLQAYYDRQLAEISSLV